MHVHVHPRCFAHQSHVVDRSQSLHVNRLKSSTPLNMPEQWFTGASQQDGRVGSVQVTWKPLDDPLVLVTARQSLPWIWAGTINAARRAAASSAHKVGGGCRQHGMLHLWVCTRHCSINFHHHVNFVALCQFLTDSGQSRNILQWLYV